MAAVCRRRQAERPLREERREAAACVVRGEATWRRPRARCARRASKVLSFLARRRGPAASSSPATGSEAPAANPREARSVASWRKELHLAAASRSSGEEREHTALARRSAEAAGVSRKAEDSLLRAARAGRLHVEEALPGMDPTYTSLNSDRRVLMDESLVIPLPTLAPPGSSRMVQ
ncbi:uncharacterized protein LOC120711109 isoform X2 [Panicum virgatum]|uniref:Uncharacterized protein n=1 Tax=Panicum virgatum TaxID=38727 RepID=A0A8T0R7P4_PANVG|nr:uncharacterized protein LOC120711109 isoform X2 [Panicum virgatum]KAG2580973.1 hypothetical protein PVAP13_6KG012128 [Panicum virgatum]